MTKKKAMQKKRGTGKLMGGLAIGLAVAIGAGVLGFYTKGFRDWTFGKAEQPPAAEANHNEQLLLTPEESNGIIMLAESEVTDEGKNVQRVTATVVPNGAELAGGLDWMLEFIEGESAGSWGSETKGAIGDYLAITDTEQANVKEIECLRAFGTQAVITVKPKEEAYAEMYARCTVDYVQKALGAGFEMWNRVTEESGLPQRYGYNYEFTPDNLNVRLPFPYATSEDFEKRFYSSYVMSGRKSMYADYASKEIRGTAGQTVNAKFSDVYTIANGVKVEGAGISTLKVWIAKTEGLERLIGQANENGLTLGSTGSEQPAAGEFTLKTQNELTVINLLSEAFGYYINGRFEDYIRLLNGMKQIAEPTVQVKITYTTRFENKEIETVYNVSRDTSGLPITEGITLEPSGGIEF